eukprot:9246301-Alexandrium_andersonii.AAC.1
MSEDAFTQQRGGAAHRSAPQGRGTEDGEVSEHCRLQGLERTFQAFGEAPTAALSSCATAAGSFCG